MLFMTFTTYYWISKEVKIFDNGVQAKKMVQGMNIIIAFD